MIELYWGSGVCDDVPALAWYLVSALVPLTLGITALATVLLGDYARAQSIAQRVANVLPADVSDQVVQLILRTRRDSPLLITISMLAIGAVCASLYHFSPRDGIPWRDAAVGAIPAAIALELTPTLAAYYLRWVAGTTPVQVFLVLAGVLFTCYIASMALLIGGAVAVRRIDGRPRHAGDETAGTLAVHTERGPGIANEDRGP